jgi:translation initiation factor 1
MKRKPSAKGGLVYSTETGRSCPACRQPRKGCSCRSSAASPAAGGAVRVGRQTKGRKGKGVTVITGLPLAPTALKMLARDLKQKCGSGGTVRDGVIEIQGDQRDMLVEELTRLGWKARKSGG